VISLRTGQGEVVKLPGLTHSQLQRAVKDLLLWHHWRVWHNQQSFGSYPGVTDLTAAKKGVLWWIEIKTPGTTLSKAQKEFRDMLIGEGCNWMVAYSVDDVIAKLGEMGRTNNA
jgi:hypothetical protein